MDEEKIIVDDHQKAKIFTARIDTLLNSHKKVHLTAQGFIYNLLLRFE